MIESFVFFCSVPYSVTHPVKRNLVLSQLADRFVQLSEREEEKTRRSPVEPGPRALRSGRSGLPDPSFSGRTAAWLSGSINTGEPKASDHTEGVLGVTVGGQTPSVMVLVEQSKIIGFTRCALIDAVAQHH